MSCGTRTRCSGDRLALYRVGQFFSCDRCLPHARRDLHDAELIRALQDANPATYAPEIADRA